MEDMTMEPSSATHSQHLLERALAFTSQSVKTPSTSTDYQRPGKRKRRGSKSIKPTPPPLSTSSCQESSLVISPCMGCRLEAISNDLMLTESQAIRKVE